MTLLTERLVGDGVGLRPIRRSDGDAIYAELSTDPTISEWTRIPWPYTRGHLDGFLDLVDVWTRGATDLVCAMTIDADRFVGLCGVHRIGQAVGPRSAFLADEVGYWVARDVRGRGVARRAVQLLCAFALVDLGIERLNLQTKVGNAASQAVARSIGFRATRMVPAREVDDDDVDHDRFDLTLADYEAAHGPSGPVIRSAL